MHYFSTNGRSSAATFEQAVLAGQPDDRGLYFPSQIPNFDAAALNELLKRPNAEIAFEVMRPYVGGEIADDDLELICSDAFDFSFPLKPVNDRIYALELFHGPTLAFKDVGARFMSRCLQYLSRNNDRKTLIIVATSGDTGGAVAGGFYGVDGIEVVILFPKDKVSRVQELQLTTFGGNITAVEVRGNFDDCQRLAKQALADTELKQAAFVTSANSINVARWLPQQIYYFCALRGWSGGPPVISVPSGNFGNLAAGILAWRSGLTVERFIAACNANDVVPNFLASGELRPKPAVPTLSNAMDVGDPSNLVRIIELFGRDLDKLKEMVAAVSVTDGQTAETLRAVKDKYNYVADPHGAVAFRALENDLSNVPDGRGIFLETAHPVKFDCVADILGEDVPVPPAVAELGTKEKHSTEINADAGVLKEILLSLI